MVGVALRASVVSLLCLLLLLLLVLEGGPSSAFMFPGEDREWKGEGQRKPCSECMKLQRINFHTSEKLACTRNRGYGVESSF